MLAEHLHPKTYWEERCELLEDAMVQLITILSTHSPPALANDLQRHHAQWGRHLTELTNRYSDTKTEGEQKNEHS